MIVYKTTNLINNKVYIGKDRKNDPSYLGSGILLQKAIKKYGKENFKKEILFESNNETEINKMEKIEIKKHINTHDCYNLAEGGTGGYTMKHSSTSMYNKWKANLSKSAKGRTVSKETREKLREVNLGKEITKEQRNKTSMTLKSTWDDPNSVFNSKEYRDKLSNSHKGRPCKKETKDKISIANSGERNGRSVSFEIDGKVFTTRRSVAQQYNISETAVSKRCKSKNFPTWKRLN